MEIHNTIISLFDCVISPHYNNDWDHHVYYKNMFLSHFLVVMKSSLLFGKFLTMKIMKYTVKR